MIDVYYWTTPNAHKITMFLEEVGAEYRIVPVAINRGEQFAPSFLQISPNNRLPAIVDHAPADGGAPLSIFESGAILIYLAEKFGRLLPTAPRPRAEVLQWLVWQVAGLGPMAGQNHHFSAYAPERIPYATKRYIDETARLYSVADKRLKDQGFIAGDFSIADIAIYPWIVPHQKQSQNLDDFPSLKRWFAAIAARPATVRAYEKGKTINTKPTVDDESRKFLFGQTAATVRHGGQG
jgi:GST-like protein